MDALRSLVQPLVGGAGGSSVIDGMKLVVLGGTVETARRVASSGWSHFVNSFFLTAHFSEEDYPYDWLMLWLSRRPEWQRSREFETTTRTSTPGISGRGVNANSFGEDDDEWGNDEEDNEAVPGKVKTRVVFQPTFDTTHTIYYRGHWLRVRRSRKNDGSNCEILSISVVARNNSILKQLVLQAKKEYEAEAVHRIQIYFADSHGGWRWTDSRHKRPMGSIVLNPGVKEMLLNDTRDFLKSEKWYADRGIPFRRGYLLHGVPGSGKSSLIHAIAGELMLDIYVVSLSSSWISDSTLNTLMGRVPARCILLLEDLDAAFTRSVSREGGDGKNSNSTDESDILGPLSSSMGGSSRGLRRSNKEQLSDVNTLSLSGLLNALDGVAAAEGRILFATTNHLERLDPALSRPGRMDVWVEFKNASKWQAEALFRNFFPSTDEDEETLEGDLDGVELPNPPMASGPPESPTTGTSSLWSMSPSLLSVSSLSSSSSSPLGSPVATSSNGKGKAATLALPQFGAKNQAYLPPPVEAHIASSQHSAKPLDAITLGLLAKKFADSIPEEEFSVAALQGYLLKNKSQPEAAANEAAAWVVSEREMKERLKREKDARDVKEKLEREKKKQEMLEKEKEKAELEKKELELARITQQLLDQEKEKAREALTEAKKKQETGEQSQTVTETPEDESTKDVKADSDAIVVVPVDDGSENSDEENVPPSGQAFDNSWGSSSGWP